MNRKYDELMERITVTPAMRRRILGRLQEAGPPGRRPAAIRFPRWRRYAALAACLALVLLGTLALPPILEGGGPEALLPDGFAVVEDADALADAVGFPVEGAGRLPFAPEEVEYSHLDGLAQILYRSGEREAVWRKAPGDGDISGDYTAYPEVRTLEAGGRTVTLKGEGGRYPLAVWTDGGYSYAVSLTPGGTPSEWREALAP